MARGPGGKIHSCEAQQEAGTELNAGPRFEIFVDNKKLDLKDSKCCLLHIPKIFLAIFGCSQSSGREPLGNNDLV